jgi:hypothetical protein
MLLLYALPIGVLAGLVAGGSVGRLADLKIRLAPLAVSGLLFQLLLFSPPIGTVLAKQLPIGPGLYVGSTLIVLAALIANVGRPGFKFILAGAALNLFAVVANGGVMPASPDAWASLHGLAGVPQDVLTNSTLASAATRLAALGDIFAVPRPLPFANVFSIGDLMIAIGGAWFIARTMSGRPVVAASPAGGPPAGAVAVGG